MQGGNFLKTSQFVTIRPLQEVCDMHAILWVKFKKLERYTERYGSNTKNSQDPLCSIRNKM